MTPLTREAIKSVLDYNADNGIFTWLIDHPSTKKTAGDKAGSLNRDGYYVIGVFGHSVLAHRLAWFIATGAWPLGQIDHKNGDRTDNRLCNLRDVEPRINSENKRRIVGASFDKETGKWRAQITAKGVSMTLGRFHSLEAAQEAYLEAKRKLHEGCTL